MVGNLVDATLALDGAFRMIGEGCTRTAYRHENVVYKVQHDKFMRPSSNISNVNEYTRISEIRGLPDNIRVPNVSLHYVSGTPVLAMDYVAGEPVGECECRWSGDICDDSCLDESVCEALSMAGMLDRAYGNIVRCNNLYYIIDFGE